MDVPFLPFAPDSAAAPMLAGTRIEPARMLSVVRVLLNAFLTGADVTDRHNIGANAGR